MSEVIDRPGKFVSKAPYLVKNRACATGPNDPLAVTVPDQSSTQTPPTTSLAMPFHHSSSRRSREAVKVEIPEEKEIEEDDDGFDPSLLPLPTDATKSATQAIWRELRVIMKEQSNSSSYAGFQVDASKLRSVYQWVVHLKDFDPKLPLAKDMRDRGVKSVDLEVRFSGEFPHVPPYIRVIRPRMLRFLHGGGGHVTAGGSICIDLLTLGNAKDRGWSSIYRMDAVLLQIKLALSSTEPRPARLDPHAWNSDYTAHEGMNAFIRVANDHGWRVPPGFRDMFSK
ncbi:ubiquitin-conjugating enzyme/RWD-like protein [Endogone sp. FLAS-F59071]|nr:ubiquitin-conjugating enzyme/RWD-like protein [Endogone sp. FLAS-F59071]|eukprot:RUS21695.1 ubiquitin-conjugating enzyme/RWD-like protein [Endogone sp. FLAS-F59071]